MFSSKDLFFTPAVSTGYTVSKSLRFRSSATAYLNRTFGTPTTQNVFTCSFWLKRGKISTQTCLFGESGISSNGLYFDAGDTLSLYFASSIVLTTAAVFRDPSAWYHVIWTSNGSTQTIYVNEVSRASGTASQTRINSAIATYIMSQTAGSIPTDGYLAEFNFIDGQALTPSSFGAYDTNGVWQPAAYTGSYGTNGFYLKFTTVGATSGSNTGYGQDFSGNGNYWTTNNFGTTSTSVDYDSMLDSPTNATGDIGNYCVLNPLTLFGNTNTAMSNANLNLTIGVGGAWRAFSGSTITMDAGGKYYYEVSLANSPSASDMQIGVATSTLLMPTGSYYPGFNANAWVWEGTGNKVNNNTGVAYGSYTSSDVIGIALDMTNGQLTFYKNGVSQGVAYTLSTSNSYVACLGGASTVPNYAVNFGQRPFAYTPPSGFSALNTQNLPTPTIANGAQYMAAVTYTGNAGTNVVTTTSANSGNNPLGTTFKPDLVWTKSRNQVSNHLLYDVVRGPGYYIQSSTSNAEAYLASTLTSFNSDGFTVGAGDNGNASGSTAIAWQWKAGGTGVTNTSGSITSTVSANTSAGFSVVTYTSPNLTADQTVGHGLGVAPAMIIVKDRDTTFNWDIYHRSLSAGEGLIFTPAAASAGRWPTTAPTTTVFSTKNTYEHNGTDKYVAYCFAPVAGYSAFGSYTGNGLPDGPFIFTGFRPRWLLRKRTDTTAYWIVYDTSRNTYNVVGEDLYPNDSLDGANDFTMDILSNGFKVRGTGANINASGGTYIYAAFAENPFKISRAR